MSRTLSVYNLRILDPSSSSRETFRPAARLYTCTLSDPRSIWFLDTSLTHGFVGLDGRDPSRGSIAGAAESWIRGHLLMRAPT